MTMWGTTDAFKQAIAAPYVNAVKLELLKDGTVQQVIPSALNAGDGTVVDGTVTVTNDAIRRTVDLTLVDVDATLTPDQAGDLLYPLHEVRPWRGLRYPGAAFGDQSEPTAVEYAPLGTFTITKVTGTFPNLSLHGFDRAWRVQRNQFTAPYQVLANSSMVDAILAILVHRLPIHLQEFNFGTTDLLTAAWVFDEQSDPWDAARRIAAAAGYILYVDPLGVFTLGPQPDQDSLPVVSFVAGSTAISLRPQRDFDAESIINAVVATGEGTGNAAPVRGYAEDINVSSPTYVNRAGRFTTFFSSPLLLTPQAAQRAAESRLSHELGLLDQVTVTALVNPALDIDDTVYVEDPDAGLTSNRLIDSFTVPLRGATHDIVTRALLFTGNKNDQPGSGTPGVIALRSVGVATTGSTPAINLQSVFPAGWAAGDLFYMRVDTGSSTVTTPTGWTPLASGSPQSGASLHQYGFFRVAVGGDLAPLVATSGSTNICIEIDSWTGVSTSDPIAASSGTIITSPTSITSPALPSLAVGDGTMLLANVTARCNTNDFGTVTLTPPSHYNEYSETATTNGGANTAVSGNQRGPIPQGTYGGEVWTASTVSMWTLIAVALRPA